MAHGEIAHQKVNDGDGKARQLSYAAHIQALLQQAFSLAIEPLLVVDVTICATGMSPRQPAYFLKILAITIATF